MGQNHKSIVTLRGDIMDIKVQNVNGKEKASFRFCTIKENKSNNETKFIKNTWFGEAWGNAAANLKNVPNMHTVTLDAEFQNYSYDSDQGKKYGVKLSVIGFGGDCGPTMYAAQYQQQNAPAGQGQAPQYQGQQPSFGMNQAPQNGYGQPPQQGYQQQPQYPPQYGQNGPPMGNGYAPQGTPPQRGYAPPPHQNTGPMSAGQTAPNSASHFNQPPPHNYAPGAHNPPPQMAPPAIDTNEQIPF